MKIRPYVYAKNTGLVYTFQVSHDKMHYFFQHQTLFFKKIILLFHIFIFLRRKLRGALRRRSWVYRLMRNSAWIVNTRIHEMNAVCTCSPENQLYPELHQNKHGQDAEGDNSPLLLLLMRPHLEYCIQLWGLPHLLKWIQRRFHRWSKDCNTSPLKTMRERWCFI